MALLLCRTTFWLSCQGFWESLTHSIYWASTVEGPDTSQPYQAHAALSCPLCSRTSSPEGAGPSSWRWGQGWGRAGRPFTCWMTSCAVLTRGALMTVRGCSGETSCTWTKKLSSELRSTSLSSCAMLLSSRFYVKKRKVWVNDNVE